MVATLKQQLGTLRDVVDLLVADTHNARTGSGHSTKEPASV
jgi:hypothetical protein